MNGEFMEPIDAIDELVARSKNRVELLKFHQYHRDHPEVLDFIVAEIRLRISKGFSATSVHSVCDYARWKLQTEAGPLEPFKLNDLFAPFYARVVVILYPDFNGHVEFRTSIVDEIFGLRLGPPPKRRTGFARIEWADGTTLEDGWRPSVPHNPTLPANRKPDIH